MPGLGTEFWDDTGSKPSAATTAFWHRFLGLTPETLKGLISGAIIGEYRTKLILPWIWFRITNLATIVLGESFWAQLTQFSA